ncbi:hypothetical protein BDQ17DRAFT_1519184, partial [Cyathus striatus]
KNKDSGLQNFQHSDAWVRCCEILQDISPQAYEMLAKHISMPRIRTLRIKRAHQVPFPMDICEHTFNLVAEQLQLLGFSGPVCLSCDDSKLLAAYRLSWSDEDQTHYLVGGMEGPLRVADPNQVKAVLDDSRSKKQKG